jgi:cysteine desulfurase
MGATRTYLDHNATSSLRPEAHAALLAALEQGGNASSAHEEGRAARRVIETAREQLASALGCLPQMITFTSGGTEANNIAIKGAAVERIIASAVEHPAVMAAAQATGKPVQVVPVSAEGVIDLTALQAALESGEGRALVSVMLANNETGVMQPVAEVSRIAAEHDALTHCDAVQALGKVPVRFAMLGADMLTFSAHKLGGPQGVGALVVRDGLALEPLTHGGGQELRRRPGTENTPGLAGFGAAVAAAGKEPHIKRLRDAFESELQALVPEVIIFGAGAERLPNTCSFAVPGIAAELAVMSLDLDGVAVSSGSACSSGKVAASHVLTAMGVDPELAACAIRVSLGWSTTPEDIEQAVQALGRIVERHKNSAAA